MQSFPDGRDGGEPLKYHLPRREDTAQLIAEARRLTGETRKAAADFEAARLRLVEAVRAAQERLDDVKRVAKEPGGPPRGPDPARQDGQAAGIR